MDIIPYSNEDILDFFDNFAAVLNNSEDCLTEFSFAEKGGSSFNRAIYADNIKPSFLREFSLRDCNVAFLTDCQRDKINSKINQTTFRQAKNESIRKKSVISFDIDFKTIDSNFLSLALTERYNFAISFAGKLVDKIQQNSIPVWIINYSGNGLHIHFKLDMPIIITDPNEYKLRYQQWTNVLALAFGGVFLFDENCSNVARLMRLPLSTNWKDQNQPIKNVIFFHEPGADASEFFENKIACTASRKLSNCPPFIKVLEYFNYRKTDTINQKGDEIVYSSPFTNDKTPSFYFN